MKRLLGYLRKNLKETILAPLFKMLEASFELAIPLVVARMIDVGIGSGDVYKRQSVFPAYPGIPARA